MLHMQQYWHMQNREQTLNEMAGACLVMRTRLVARVISGIYDDALRPYGVNSAQFALLVVIHKLGSASRAEIGRFNRQDRSTLTRNLVLILHQGWAEETGATGRARPICLTEAGRELLASVSPAWQTAQRQAEAILGEDGIASITKIANKLINAS